MMKQKIQQSHQILPVPPNISEVKKKRTHVKILYVKQSTNSMKAESSHTYRVNDVRISTQATLLDHHHQSNISSKAMTR
jgi:hypothetical protein